MFVGNNYPSSNLILEDLLRRESIRNKTAAFNGGGRGGLLERAGVAGEAGEERREPGARRGAGTQTRGHSPGEDSELLGCRALLHPFDKTTGSGELTFLRL